MAGRVLEIRFPSAGVDRRAGFRELMDSRSPYPTPWAVNMRPADPLADRLRGGSRPGVTAHGSTAPAAPTVPLQTEAGVDILTEDGQQILFNPLSIAAAYPAAAKAIKYYGMVDLSAVESNVGTAPTGYTFGCKYRGRLILAGGDNVIYASRMDDYADWNYGANVDDPGRAFIAQLAEAGEQGETVTALMPYRDAAMLAATEHSLWAFHGDPAGGGSLRKVSDEIGIVSSTARCLVGGMVYFLSRLGLYAVQPDGDGLKAISDERLPAELEDIDLTAVDVHLGYNPKDRGLYIFLVGGDYHYYYDLVFGGFWPFTLPAALDPTAVFTYEGELLLRHSSSYYTLTGDDDAGTDIESHLLLGPFRLGSTDEFGMISALHAALGDDSGTVNWKIVPGKTANEACENGKDAIELFMDGDSDYESLVYSYGSWAAGRSHMAYPRVRAMWAVVWLQADAPWAFENLAMEVQKFGRWR